MLTSNINPASTGSLKFIIGIHKLKSCWKGRMTQDSSGLRPTLQALNRERPVQRQGALELLPEVAPRPWMTCIRVHPKCIQMWALMFNSSYHLLLKPVLFWGATLPKWFGRRCTAGEGALRACTGGWVGRIFEQTSWKLKSFHLEIETLPSRGANCKVSFQTGSENSIPP